MRVFLACLRETNVNAQIAYMHLIRVKVRYICIPFADTFDPGKGPLALALWGCLRVFFTQCTNIV